jgi:hypothetical protein
MRTAALIALLALAACSRTEPQAANTAEPAPAGAAAPTLAPPPATDAYLGRWIAVEGMYLVVAPGPLPGQYALEMQWDLDHKGQFTGTAEGDAIAFTRDGMRLALRPTNGAATGLKYLDGKARCLTVKAGEGYCRD